MKKAVIHLGHVMQRCLIAASAIVLSGAGALADAKPTEAEAAKIKQTAAAWGCEGGTYEKESEGSGVFEAEDVKCRGGQYDIRLDKDFNVLAITRD